MVEILCFRSVNDRVCVLYSYGSRLAGYARGYMPGSVGREVRGQAAASRDSVPAVHGRRQGAEVPYLWGGVSTRGGGWDVSKERLLRASAASKHAGKQGRESRGAERERRATYKGGRVTIARRI